MVRTAKYEFYNFLPKFLWEEFNPATKIANVYFLFIAALQASKRCWHTPYMYTVRAALISPLYFEKINEK